MATHHTPQSLPSFALAFSSSSLNNIHPNNNALPPIQPRRSLDRFQRRKVTPSSRDQSRHPSVERNPPSQSNGRKRSREDASSASNSGSDRQSPRVIRVKEEEEHDMLDATPPPPPPSQSRLLQPGPSQDTSSVSPSSNLGPPSKKRRVSISNAPHRLDTDVRAPSLDPSNSTPISPAVMGFTIGRDDPIAIEQVRSMLTVKQKQKALIEQRRGSVAGLVNTKPSNPIMNEARRGSVAGILTVAPNGDSSPRATGAIRIPSGNGANPSEERLPRPPPSTRSTRRSPITGIATNTTSRRVANAPPLPNQNESGSGRPPSPTPIMVPSQQTQLTQNQQTHHNLPPPPISFAHRRAEQFGKNKPADIVISPREAQSPDQLALSIQSAPPVPHAQSQSIGRFPMTLPRLPAAMGDSQNIQRVTSGKVPPTPTRLTMQRGPAGRSPSDASVPIATTLVPPTPVSLHRPGYVGEKSAFLAPFETFYDSLNDSKQLKNWLSDQLQKSHSLMQSLKHQQENLDEMVERAVQKRMGRMRDDMAALHRKVEELEGALHTARADESSRRPSSDVLGGVKGRGRYMIRNGIPPPPEPPASYTFPPIDGPTRRPELLRKMSSPSWAHESDRECRNMQGSEKTSPPPQFDADRRLSVSSSRYEPPRPQPMETSLSRGSQGSSRGPPGFTPLGPTVKNLSTPANAKLPQQPTRTSQQERPSFHQRRSSDAVGEAPSNSPGTDRRNPAIMSPPDDIRRPSTEDG